VFEFLGRELPREAASIAVNSQVARTQDQLHLHIDCVDSDVARALLDHNNIDFHWREMTIALKGRRYWYAGSIRLIYRIRARSGCLPTRYRTQHRIWASRRLSQ
jgi:CDP-diacylglycerol pyrophosphatase